MSTFEIKSIYKNNLMLFFALVLSFTAVGAYVCFSYGNFYALNDSCFLYNLGRQNKFQSLFLFEIFPTAIILLASNFSLLYVLGIAFIILKALCIGFSLFSFYQLGISFDKTFIVFLFLSGLYIIVYTMLGAHISLKSSKLKNDKRFASKSLISLFLIFTVSLIFNYLFV